MAITLLVAIALFNFLISYTHIVFNSVILGQILFITQIIFWIVGGILLTRQSEQLATIINHSFILTIPSIFLVVLDSIKIAILGYCDNLSRYWLGPTEDYLRLLPLGNWHSLFVMALFPSILILTAILTKRNIKQ